MDKIKSLFVAFCLLLIGNIFAQSEPECPPGTELVWGCLPGEKILKQLCAVCTKDGNTQSQKVETVVYTGSHSGSHSGVDGNDLNAAATNRFPFLPQIGADSFFARSWQEMLLSKEALYTALSLTGISYTYVYYQLKKAVWLINNKNAWCNWKEDISSQELYTIPRKQLAAELLQKIQVRYLNPKNPTDHVGPLNVFLEDYRIELHTFRDYFRIAKWLTKFHLTNLFPIKQEEMNKMKEGIERLSYLKSVFFDWTTEYKTTRCFPDIS